MNLSSQTRAYLTLWNLPLHCGMASLVFFLVAKGWQHQDIWLFGLPPLAGGFLVLEHFGSHAIIRAAHPHFPASIFRYTAAQKVWRKQYKKSGQNNTGCLGSLIGGSFPMLLSHGATLWAQSSPADYTSLLINGVVLALIYGVILGFMSNDYRIRYGEAFLKELPERGFTLPDDYPPKPVIVEI